jgi:hypothetical protein
MRIIDALDEIRAEHLPNASLKRYRYSNLLLLG